MLRRILVPVLLVAFAVSMGCAHSKSAVWTPPPIPPRPIHARPTTPSPGPTPVPTPLAIGDSTVYIHPRTEWADANPIVGRLDPMGRPACITVHHEGQDTGFMSQAAVCSHLRAIRSQQVKTKASGGLCAGDIAYHFIIDPSGTVWEGRPLQYQGAHAGNSEANRGNIGVCLLGEFDSQQVPYAQKKSLRAVLAMLMGRYAIPSGGILTHREVKRRFGLPPTQCPGDHLQAYVDGLRAELGLAHR